MKLILAGVIVLIKHCNLGVGQVLEDVAGIDARLDPVAGPPTHRPGMMLGIVPFIGAGGDE